MSPGTLETLLGMKRRTIIINSVLAAAVLVVAGLAWAAFGHSTAQAATSTGTVGQGTVLATSTASGTVIAPDDVGLNFGSSGTVTSVRVKVGEKVSKGEVLATIDTTSAEEQLAQAQAQLAQAELTLYDEENGISTSGSSGSGGSGSSTSTGSTNSASTTSSTSSSDAKAMTAAAHSVNQAEAALTSALTQASSSKTPLPPQLTVSITKAISSLGAASASLQVTTTGSSGSNQTAVQASSTTSSDSSTVSTEQIDVAEANVTAAKAQVATAETALDGTTITAPAAGTVASISGTVGEQASGGSSSSSSGSSNGANSTSSSSSEPTGFIVLTGIGPLEVTASFSEADTTSIKVGAGAKITFPALSGVDLNGNVLSIAAYPTTSSGLTTYAVTLSLVSPPATLKVGQSASISVITAEADNTLFVPSSAVSTLGGINTVTVVDNGTRTVKTVTIGVQGDSTTQIKSGLTKGETVVLTSSSSGSTSSFPTGGIPRAVTGGGLGGTTTFGGGTGSGRG
jgi:membrane fusion protein, macrolide-specific efflux system